MNESCEDCAKRINELEKRVAYMTGVNEWQQHDLIEICKDLDELKELVEVIGESVRALTDVLDLLFSRSGDEDEFDI